MARRRGRRPSPRRGRRSTTTGGRRSRRRPRDPRVVAIGETGPRLRPGLLADPRPAREPPAEPRAGGRDRQAGDPPLPLGGRASARRRTRCSRELRAFGSEPPPVVIHSFSGPVDYAEAMLELGAAISISGLAFRAGEEATGRRRPRSCRPTASSSRPTRRSCAARRAARPERARVGPGDRPLGRRAARPDAGRRRRPVAAYDAIFGRRAAVASDGPDAAQRQLSDSRVSTGLSSRFELPMLGSDVESRRQPGWRSGPRPPQGLAAAIRSDPGRARQPGSRLGPARSAPG